MRRQHLEHLIRAAADLTGDTDFVIVGSQAILGTYPDAPGELLRSMEADLYPRNHPEREIELGVIGDGSVFHDTFGYFADGVGPETAKAPEGWEERLVPVVVATLRGGATATGWCLEPHDLVLAKCAARRDRDWAFARVALAHGLVEPETLWRRAHDLPLNEVALAYVLQVLGPLVGRGG